MSDQPIELYYWPTPNGHKITIMLEECGLPYVIKYVNIGKGQQFEPDFLKIAPNNRMPAIIDPGAPDGPDGPDGTTGQPISVFESGAILQYLGRKAGMFYPSDARTRAGVDQWLMWQMGGLGPMAGQAHHFRQYAPEKVPYAIDRYTDECNRLYGVMNTCLKSRDFLAGEYSIADIACYPWIRPYKRQGQDLEDFPALNKWFSRIHDRDAVIRAYAIEDQTPGGKFDLSEDKDAQAMLFGQKAR